MNENMNFKVYTSYFGNMKNLVAANIEPVGISVFPPSWFNGRSLLMLAPTSQMLRLSTPEYNRQFKQRLALLDSSKVVDLLKGINRVTGKDIAMCCFEKNPVDCHRSMVSRWLNAKEGMDVQEWTKVKVVRQGYTQADLF